jgi:hypothetical protein
MIVLLVPKQAAQGAAAAQPVQLIVTVVLALRAKDF